MLNSIRRASSTQLGTWALLSMETEDLETGEKHNLLGAHPSGYLSYGADCRMSAILVKESREGPAALVATDSGSLELYRGLIAYAGSYAIDGSKITQHIEDLMEPSVDRYYPGQSIQHRWKVLVYKDRAQRKFQ